MPKNGKDKSKKSKKSNKVDIQNNNSESEKINAILKKYEIGIRYYKKGEEDNALKCFDEILREIPQEINQSPKNKLLELSLEILKKIMIIFVRQEKYISVIKTTSVSILWLSKTNMDISALYLQRATAWSAMDLLLNAQKDFQAAGLLIQKLFPEKKEFNEQLFQPYLGEARAYYELSKYSEAQSSLKLAKKHVIDDSKALQELTQLQTLLEAQNRPQENDAIVDLSQSGFQSFFDKRFKEAFTFYVKVINVVRSKTNAYYANKNNTFRAKDIVFKISIHCIDYLGEFADLMMSTEIKKALFSIFLDVFDLNENLFSDEHAKYIMEFWYYYLTENYNKAFGAISNAYENFEEVELDTLVQCLEKFCQNDKISEHKEKAYFYLSQLEKNNLKWNKVLNCLEKSKALCQDASFIFLIELEKIYILQYLGLKYFTLSNDTAVPEEYYIAIKDLKTCFQFIVKQRFEAKGEDLAKVLESIAHLQEALEQLCNNFNEKLLEIYLEWARCLLPLEKYEESQKFCQRIIDELAKLQLSKDRADELFPQCFEIFYNLGLKYHEKNESGKAIENFTIALSLDSISSELKSGARLCRGLTYYKSNNIALAKTDFLNVSSASVEADFLNVNPVSVDAYFHLSLIALIENDEGNARELIQKVLTNDLNSLDSYYKCAEYYYERQKYHEVIICLEFGYSFIKEKKNWLEAFPKNKNLFNKIFKKLKDAYFLYGDQLGKTKEIKSKEIIAYWTKAAEMGKAKAEYTLALNCLKIGENNNAFIRLSSAVLGGYHSAGYLLGICFFYGIGTLQDKDNAFLYLDLAAKRGSAEAIRFLELYQLQINPFAYQKPQTDDADTQYLIAYYTENNLGGFEMDLSKAKEWYEKSASKDHIGSLLRLAKAQALGELDIKPDTLAAISLYNDVLKFADNNIEAKTWLSVLLISKVLTEYIKMKNHNKELFSLFFEKNKDWIQAKQILKSTEPKDEKILYLLGLIAWYENETVAAKEYFQSVLSCRNLEHDRFYINKMANIASICLNSENKGEAHIENFFQYKDLLNNGGDSYVYLQAAFCCRKILELPNIKFDSWFERTIEYFQKAIDCGFISEFSKLLMLCSNCKDIKKTAISELIKIEEFYKQNLEVQTQIIKLQNYLIPHTALGKVLHSSPQNRATANCRPVFGPSRPGTVYQSYPISPTQRYMFWQLVPVPVLFQHREAPAIQTSLGAETCEQDKIPASRLGKQ